MARPLKEGLEYYPKDTDYFNDRKIRKLLKEFGLKGYVVFDYILGVVYREKGYYLEYDQELAFDIADRLGNEITEDAVNEIVNGCVRIGLFDKNLFESSNILTSSGIQKRYVLIKKTRVIDERIRVNVEETQVNESISTQRKEKESKENKSKEKENIDHVFSSSPFYDFLLFEKEFLGSEYERCDLKIYHEKVKNWSASKGAKKKDWIATARNFMLSDKQEGKLILKKALPSSVKQTVKDISPEEKRKEYEKVMIEILEDTFRLYMNGEKPRDPTGGLANFLTEKGKMNGSLEGVFQKITDQGLTVKKYLYG